MLDLSPSFPLFWWTSGRCFANHSTISSTSSPSGCSSCAALISSQYVSRGDLAAGFSWEADGILLCSVDSVQSSGTSLAGIGVSVLFEDVQERQFAMALFVRLEGGAGE